MSSLRRREIVVSRARSTERSSTGGRVSARAAAAESSGSASIRSQAIASRTSGRLEERGRPDDAEGDAALLHRRRDRVAVAGRLVDDDADSLGPEPRRRSGARPRAPPPAPGRARCEQRQKRTGASASAARPGFSSRSSIRGDHRARGVGDVLPAAKGAVEDDDVGVGMQVAKPGGGAAAPGPRRGVVVQRAEEVGGVGAELGEQRPAGEGRVLELVDHQVAEAAGDLAPHVGALGEQAAQRQDHVAGVEAVGGGEDPVVLGVEVGELALAPRRLARGLVAGRACPLARPRRRGSAGAPPRS